MNIFDDLLALMERKESHPYPAHEYTLIPAAEVPFEEGVRKACEANYCGKYGTCLTCPPGVGDWQMWRDKLHAYDKALIFSTRHELEDSFDIEGMAEGHLQHKKLAQMVFAFLQSRQADFCFLGAEGCDLCEKCTYPTSPCRFPDKASPSIEACGVNVVALTQKCGIHYINGMNTVTYFSAVFLRQAH